MIFDPVQQNRSGYQERRIVNAVLVGSVKPKAPESG